MRLNCEICGEQPSDQCELYQCIECGNTICDGCLINPTKEEKLKFLDEIKETDEFKNSKLKSNEIEIIIKNIKNNIIEDEDLNEFDEYFYPDFYEDEVEVPPVYCPICQFKVIPDEELLEFLLKRYAYLDNSLDDAKKELQKQIKNRFKTRKKFLDYFKEKKIILKG